MPVAAVCGGRREEQVKANARSCTPSRVQRSVYTVHQCRVCRASLVPYTSQCRVNVCVRMCVYVCVCIVFRSFFHLSLVVALVSTALFFPFARVMDTWASHSRREKEIVGAHLAPGKRWNPRDLSYQSIAFDSRIANGDGDGGGDEWIARTNLPRLFLHSITHFISHFGRVSLFFPLPRCGCVYVKKVNQWMNEWLSERRMNEWMSLWVIFLSPLLLWHGMESNCKFTCDFFSVTRSIYWTKNRLQPFALHLFCLLPVIKYLFMLTQV